MVAVPNLACIRCHAPLPDQATDSIRCTGCGTTYPVLGGIPSFVTRSDAAAAASALDLSVVIPLMNDGEDMTPFISRLKQALSDLGSSHEIIVVTTGSINPRPAAMTGAGVSVVAQRLPGYGGALRTGFEVATGSYVLTLDADGSHDPDLIRTIWDAREQAEVVIASRYVAGGRAEMPALRSALSRALNVAFRRGLSLPVRDLSSGYRLYQRPLLSTLQLHATAFDLLEEILIRTLAEGYRIAEVPFSYRARRDGRGVNLGRFSISYLKTLGAMWKLRNSIGSADYDARAYSSIIPLQRYWQRRRHRVITGLAGPFRSVLDVGCGSSRILASRPMVGLDIQMHKLRYARRYGNPLVHGSIFELPFADESFDCVICSEVIEHVPADERVFTELERVLKPGGRLILGTPDYDRWQWRTLEWIYGRVSPGGYADEHITHFGRANLERYLAARGLQLEEIQYVGASEMIFALRKPQSGRPGGTVPSVSSSLRSEKRAPVTSH